MKAKVHDHRKGSIDGSMDGLSQFDFESRHENIPTRSKADDAHQSMMCIHAYMRVCYTVDMINKTTSGQTYWAIREVFPNPPLEQFFYPLLTYRPLPTYGLGSLCGGILSRGIKEMSRENNWSY